MLHYNSLPLLCLSFISSFQIRLELYFSLKKLINSNYLFYHTPSINNRFHILLIFHGQFQTNTKRRHRMDFSFHTVPPYIDHYHLIVFANDVSNAVISGFPSTFISSSASTPSGTVIVLLPSSCSFICGLRFSLL